MPNHVRQRLTVCGRPEDVRAFIVTARGASPVTGDRPDPERPGEQAPNVIRELHVEPLNFHMIAPLPDDFSRNTYGSSRGRGRQGIDMETDGWGVKWGPYQVDREPGESDEELLARVPIVSEDGALATYEFTCAWSMPGEALTRASVRYRMLAFFLSWGGEGPTRGRATFIDGEATVLVKENGGDDFPTWNESDEGDEEADERFSRLTEEAERKYIATHDEWVSLTWRATAAARILAERAAGP